MIKKAILLFAIISGAHYCQQDSLIEVPEWYEPITEIPSNMTSFVSGSFSKENIKSLSFLAFSTAGLIAVDQDAYESIRGVFRRNHNLNLINNTSVHFGNGTYNIALSGAFTAYGLVMNDKTALRTGIQCLEAILSTGLTVQLLKRITGRESPLKATAPTGKWSFFPNPEKYQHNQPKYYAFPSGHLSTAVTTLVVIAENYPNDKYILPVGYSLLGFLAVSLVAKDMHWMSDFPLAFAIGYSYGKIITSGNSKKGKSTENDNKVDISILPFFNSTSQGLSLSVQF